MPPALNEIQTVLDVSHVKILSRKPDANVRALIPGWRPFRRSRDEDGFAQWFTSFDLALGNQARNPRIVLGGTSRPVDVGILGREHHKVRAAMSRSSRGLTRGMKFCLFASAKTRRLPKCGDDQALRILAGSLVVNDQKRTVQFAGKDNCLRPPGIAYSASATSPLVLFDRAPSHDEIGSLVGRRCVQTRCSTRIGSTEDDVGATRALMEGGAQRCVG